MEEIVISFKNDEEEEDYKADAVISLRDFLHITMTLTEVFENVE